MNDPVSLPFESFAATVPLALDALGAAEFLAKQERVLLKPNLVGPMDHPVTTHPEHVRAVARYVREHSRAEVLIGEGTGDAGMETDEVFSRLGYDRLARELGQEIGKVELLDLNHAPLRTVRPQGLAVFAEMHLPEVVLDSCVISLPVLKAHSLARITGSLKNMMGVLPPQFYSGGGWKKAKFHQRMQGSLRDLARCFLPGLTVMDASIGLRDYHLGGARCDPPLNRLLAGYDPYAVDRLGAELLGLDWRDIGHLRDS